jgi:hypothetical protein
MLSEETLAEYRRMTPGERLKRTLELSNKHMSSLFKGTPREIERRLERMRRDKAERNFTMLIGLARHRYVTAGLLDKEVSLDEFPRSCEAVSGGDSANSFAGREPSRSRPATDRRISSVCLANLRTLYDARA